MASDQEAGRPAGFRDFFYTFPCNLFCLLFCLLFRDLFDSEKYGFCSEAVPGTDRSEALPSGACVVYADSTEPGQPAADKSGTDTALQKRRCLNSRRIPRIRVEGVGVPDGTGEAPDRIYGHCLVIETSPGSVRVVLAVNPMDRHFPAPAPVFLFDKGINPPIPFIQCDHKIHQPR